MGRALLMFIGTGRVDSYINVMANAVDKCNVTKIVLVKILNAPAGQQGKPDEFYEELLRAVKGLAEGKYESKPGNIINIGTAIPEYKKLKEVFSNNHAVEPVNYLFLRDEIAKLKNFYGPDPIVDVTGTLKRIAIDVLAACLAVDMKYVTLFELRKPPSGVNTLYHILKNTSDYDLVILPNEAPLLSNIAVFAAQQNRQKLRVVIAAILVSIVLTVLYQILGIAFGSGNWILVVAIVFIGIFSGIIPIMDAWGGGRLSSFGKQKN